MGRYLVKTWSDDILKKPVFSFLTALLLLCTACFPLGYAAGGEPNESLLEEAEAVYDTAAALYQENTGCQSFYGNCGTYISYTLCTLGLSDYLGGHNGNQWFDAYENGEPAGSCTAYTFAGSEAVEALLGDDRSYVLISYTHQTGYTDENPGAGHAVFIYRIEDGIAYFTESYAMYGVPEGEAHAWEVERLLDTYQSWYGDPIGAVWFTDTEAADDLFDGAAPSEATTQSSAADFPYTIDSDLTVLSAIPPQTTAAAFIESLSQQDFSVTLPETMEETETTYIATGMPLTITYDGEDYELTAAVSGDLNGDGRQTSSDARTALRIAIDAYDEPVTASMQKAADVNDDGKLNTADARNILRATVHLSD